MLSKEASAKAGNIISAESSHTSGLNLPVISEANTQKKYKHISKCIRFLQRRIAVVRTQHLRILRGALNIKIVHHFTQNVGLQQLCPNSVF